ncbi:MAG: ABC transporter substrate-binding protein [Ferruginibacter sp.]
MKKKILLFSSLLFASVSIGFAQDGEPLKTYRVGIFSALYLDSIFTGTTYNYGKKFPKFAQHGLDFVQGAQIALDSLPLPNGNVIATIFDSKAKLKTIPWLIENKQLDSLDLLIGAVKDAEFLELAAFAKQKNIPFISATYPNDGGVTNNPFLVIVNATLRAHCETIYSYLLQSRGTDKIFFCRKKGSQEDKIAEYFRAINEAEGKPLLTIETLYFEDDFNSLKSKLDSNRKSVIVGTSLSETFATNLVNSAYLLKDSYPLEVIGMPNWDGFAALKKPALKDLPLYFTTAFSNTKSDAYARQLQNIYSKKYKGVPSDMAYKGYETVFVFARLITRYPNDFMSHLNEYAYKVFNDYNFKAVYIDRKTKIPDYFENKRLYFMKILNGKISKVW